MSAIFLSTACNDEEKEISTETKIVEVLDTATLNKEDLVTDEEVPEQAVYNPVKVPVSVKTSTKKEKRKDTLNERTSSVPEENVTPALENPPLDLESTKKHPEHSISKRKEILNSPK